MRPRSRGRRPARRCPVHGFPSVTPCAGGKAGVFGKRGFRSVGKSLEDTSSVSSFLLPSHDVLRIAMSLVPRLLFPRVRNVAPILRMLFEEVLDEGLEVVPHDF